MTADFPAGDVFRGILVRVPVVLFGAGLVIGCGSEPSPTPTPDPRIDQLERLIQGVDATVERIEQQVARLDQSPTPAATPTPSPSPTATPSPQPSPTPTATASPRATPTPGPPLDQIEKLIDTRVTVALAANPTPNPLSLPAPGPSLQEVEVMIEAAVGEAISAIPTAAPTPTAVPTPTPVSLPALVAVVPQVSGSAVTSLPGGITLMIDPGQPLAGRDVSFTLEGLGPWQAAVVEFVDPLGRPAEWITRQEVRFTQVNDVPVTKRILFADESGRVGWLRIGTRDAEGIWSVRVTVEGLTVTATYPVTELQLPSPGLKEVAGVEFRSHEGVVSSTSYSTLVPASLAVDMQAHLVWAAGRLREDLGVQSTTIPDLYLLGNETVLAQITASLGIRPGFEDGYFISAGAHPGIYVRTYGPLPRGHTAALDSRICSPDSERDAWRCPVADLARGRAGDLPGAGAWPPGQPIGLLQAQTVRKR